MLNRITIPDKSSTWFPRPPGLGTTQSFDKIGFFPAGAIGKALRESHGIGAPIFNRLKPSDNTPAHKHDERRDHPLGLSSKRC